MTSTTEEYTLTAPGWPRPNIGGYPIPWVAPAEKLSEVNEGRRLASVGGSICQVCGLSFGYGDVAYGFIETGPALAGLELGSYLGAVFGSSTPITFLDGALLHMDCARLTAVMCPHVRDRANLVMIEVPANDADPQRDFEGTLRPMYPAGDCKLVAWPTER